MTTGPSGPADSSLSCSSVGSSVFMRRDANAPAPGRDGASPSPWGTRGAQLSRTACSMASRRLSQSRHKVTTAAAAV